MRRLIACLIAWGLASPALSAALVAPTSVDAMASGDFVKSTDLAAAIAAVEAMMPANPVKSVNGVAPNASGAVTIQMPAMDADLVHAADLAPYATASSVTSAISSATTGLATTSSVNSAISAATAGLATTSSVNSAISAATSGLVTSSSLTSALAGTVKTVNGLTPDGSGAVSLAVPQPASTLPQPETIGGAVGSSTEYMRRDAKIPRITRAQTVLTQSGGTFSGTWADPLMAAPMLILTPISSGTSMVYCKLTSDPTTTSFAGICKTEQSTILSLSIVTTGLTLSPSATTSAGIKVQVIALPPTQ